MAGKNRVKRITPSGLEALKDAIRHWRENLALAGKNMLNASDIGPDQCPICFARD